jgi:hypothetical protein
MEPHFVKNDKNMFYNFLNNASVYFEYGSGGSTYQASIRDNINKIYSVESDTHWQDLLKIKINKNNINFIFNEMDTRPRDWGNPGPNATLAQRLNYSSHLGKLSEEEQKSIDFMLIDGRFRVACCLKAHALISDKCLIAFDDFLNRRHYHSVLDYYDILQHTQDKSMVILRKKRNTSVPEDVIKRFENIHG